MEQNNIEILFQIRLVSVLAAFGKRTDHVGRLYYSPFRDEASPSMRVTNRNGCDFWVDYGADLTNEDRRAGRKFHGGGVYALAKELGGYSDHETIEFLKGIDPSLAIEDTISRSDNSDKPSGIVIDSVSEHFTVRSLIDYAEKERFIPINILEKFCRQVGYHASSSSNPKTYYKIGFCNNSGSWELRSRPKNSGDRFAKISSGKDITTIARGGEFSPEPKSGSVLVFEGFMDFLSWAALKKGVIDTDVCVLNSAGNAYRALGYINAHKKCNLSVDKDRMGDRTCEIFRQECRGVEFKDCRTAYGTHKDLNEWLQSRMKMRQTYSQSKEEPPSNGKRLKNNH